MGAVDARVPDLPQYIISKLGLDKNLINGSTFEVGLSFYLSYGSVWYTVI